MEEGLHLLHYNCYFWHLCFLFLILHPQHINSSLVPSSNNKKKSCLHDQSLALLQFKASFSVDERYVSYSKLWSWNAHTDCCSWDGITCDGDNNGYVIGVDVSQSGLEGPIDSSINSLFPLHHLRSLNLAYNQFNISSSSPPTLFKHAIFSLTHLNLSSFLIAGQIRLEISQFKDLVSLDISSLDLVNVKSPAMLTTLIRSFSSLRELYMDSLNVNKQPATDWFQAISSAKLPNLQVLSLTYCGFSGSIEYSSLSNLLSLSHLYLSYNNITHIPHEMFNLPNLQVLDMSANDFLTGFFPEFPQHSTLQQLIFSQTQFSGTIPHSIGNLKFLTKLQFHGCNISGAVPDSFGNLGQLMFVDLSHNNLKGEIPSSISKLSHLVVLDLSFNTFVGPLPILKSSSKTITVLDLSFNNFTGPIPSSYANNIGLPKLQRLFLSANSLTGSIPSSIFNLPSLESIRLDTNKLSGELDDIEYYFPSPSPPTQLLDIDLCDNMLEGRIPTLFSKLSSLEVLILCKNNFHGMVDHRMFESLRNLSYIDLSNNRLLSIEATDTMFAIRNLDSFHFSSCNLSEFPRFLKYQKQMKVIDLSNNQLQGKMPEWIWTRVSTLNLSHNSLVGFEQPLSDHSSSILVTLDLSSNIFQGSIPMFPDTLSYLSFSNNSLIGEIPLTICNPRVGYIDLSKNQISGMIPSCLFNLGTPLSLDLSKNKLQGSIPHNIGDRCNILRLNFNGNQLEGPLPRSLANCRSFKILDLGNNKINDTFPLWLESLEELQVLMLQSNRFHGRIGHRRLNNSSFPKLHIINLSSNNFTGRLPIEYFRSSKVMTMDGEDYKDIERRMHDEDERLAFYDYGTYRKSLTLVPNKGQVLEYATSQVLILNVIDLSSNQFNEEVPELIGDFKPLVVLNLSHNHLTGEIPSSLGNLRELQSLDLSNNDLLGEIPSELTSLTFLSVLNLSWNHLEGRIPSGGQFDTFPSSSFEGNLGICGSQLQIECNKQSDNAPSSEEHYSHENSNTNFDWIFALAGYGSGLVIGVVIEHFLLSRNMYYLGKIMNIERFIQDKKRSRRIPRQTRRN